LTARPATKNNAIEVSIESEAGSSFALQASSNAVDWFDAATYENAPSAITFLDTPPAPPDPPRRFFRTISK
jgi:hypothetical protein